MKLSILPTVRQGGIFKICFQGYLTRYDYLTKYLTIFFIFFITIILIHLFLGSSPILLLISLVLFFLSLFHILIHRSITGGQIIIFFYVFNTAIFAVILKSILGQPLQSNLLNANLSYTVVFISAIEIVLAYLIVDLIPIKKKILMPINDVHSLRFIMFSSFSIGSLSWLLNQIFLIDRRSPNFDASESFGGFAVFVPLFYLSIISATALALLNSGNKKSINKYVVFFIFLGILFGLIDSRKIYFGLSFLSYFLTCFVYRWRITGAQLASFIFIFIFIFFIVGPFTHMFRGDLWFFSFDQKIYYLQKHWDQIINWQNCIDNLRTILEKPSGGYHYEYFGRNMFFLDRFATIQHSDVIINAFQNRESIGYSEILTDGYKKILPSFIFSNKPTIALSDRITWEIGLRKYGVIGFATVPLNADAFVAAKWIGVLFIPFYIFLLLFLILKKIGWYLDKNIFACFFILSFIIGIQEFSHSQLVLSIFRELPVQLLVLILLFKVRDFKLKRKTSHLWQNNYLKESPKKRPN